MITLNTFAVKFLMFLCKPKYMIFWKYSVVRYILGIAHDSVDSVIDYLWQFSWSCFHWEPSNWMIQKIMKTFHAQRLWLRFEALHKRIFRALAMWINMPINVLPFPTTNKIHIPNFNRILSMNTLDKSNTVTYTRAIDTKKRVMSHIKFRIYFIPVILTVLHVHHILTDVAANSVSRGHACINCWFTLVLNYNWMHDRNALTHPMIWARILGLKNRNRKTISILLMPKCPPTLLAWWTLNKIRRNPFGTKRTHTHICFLLLLVCNIIIFRLEIGFCLHVDKFCNTGPRHCLFPGKLVLLW